MLFSANQSAVNDGQKAWICRICSDYLSLSYFKFVWFLCSLRKAAGEAMGKAMNAMGMDEDGSGQ